LNNHFYHFLCKVEGFKYNNNGNVLIRIYGVEAPPSSEQVQAGSAKQQNIQEAR
jgi:hypothetical protein